MLGLNRVQLDLYRHGRSKQLYMLYVLCLVHCTQYKYRKYNKFDNSIKNYAYITYVSYTSSRTSLPNQADKKAHKQVAPKATKAVLVWRIARCGSDPRMDQPNLPNSVEASVSCTTQVLPLGFMASTSEVRGDFENDPILLSLT